MARRGEPYPREEEPLRVSCTSVDCENDLHCFKATQAMRVTDEQGLCRSCGAALVDWDRIHVRDRSDSDYTFRMLRLEMIRHHFWHVQLDQRAVNHARRKGRIQLREAADRRITQSISPASPSYDGRQTPREGNSIYYAQHATATCCRTCLEYWHGIPKGRGVTREEINYLLDLVMSYVNDRMPDLADEPVKVPPIRRASRREGQRPDPAQPT